MLGGARGKGAKSTEVIALRICKANTPDLSKQQYMYTTLMHLHVRRYQLTILYIGTHT